MGGPSASERAAPARTPAGTGNAPCRYRASGADHRAGSSDRCKGWDQACGYPFAETKVLLVFRRYNSEGTIPGGTIVRLPKNPRQAQVVVDRALHAAFAGPEVALLHVRAVGYGCFHDEVRRPCPSALEQSVL
ncbi:DUF1203 domain-containing protein [Streptomyces sp. NPDC006314]|uniref:DUF1203 domain-containing protein n=1 Tax=Streptomyces sp. NPDC006314 TaxID=3154475 RepID=UPI0033AE857A